MRQKPGGARINKRSVAGKCLRRLAEDLPFSQNEWADRADISKSTLSSYMNHYIPDPFIIDQLSNAANLNTEKTGFLVACNSYSMFKINFDQMRECVDGGLGKTAPVSKNEEVHDAIEAINNFLEPDIEYLMKAARLNVEERARQAKIHLEDDFFL